MGSTGKLVDPPLVSCTEAGRQLGDAVAELLCDDVAVETELALLLLVAELELDEDAVAVGLPDVDEVLVAELELVAELLAVALAELLEELLAVALLEAVEELLAVALLELLEELVAVADAEADDEEVVDAVTLAETLALALGDGSTDSAAVAVAVMENDGCTGMQGRGRGMHGITLVGCTVSHLVIRVSRVTHVEAVALGIACPCACS
jgi:hypothetical protein